MDLTTIRQNADHGTDHVMVDAINRRLAEEYRVLDGRAIYRIVWSDEQFEVRRGTFTDWYGHIMIRQEHNITREVKKYWYFDKPSWVLEKLVYFHNRKEMEEVAKELVQSRNGSYETVYRFYRASTKQNLPVNWRIAEFIVWRLHNPGEPVDVKKAQEIEEKEEVAYFEDQLSIESENKRSPLFVADNAVGVSTNQMIFRNSREAPLIYTESLSIGDTNANAKG